MSINPSFKPDSILVDYPAEIAFHFQVMVGIEIVGDFQSVEGIESTMPITDFNEGGRNHTPHRLRWNGPVTKGELTLRWGMLSKSALYDWMQAVERGYFFRKDVYILQLDRVKSPIRLMRLSKAFPIRWVMGSLNANSNDWATEELTLAYDDVNLIVIPKNLISGVGGADSVLNAIRLFKDDATATTVENEPEYEFTDEQQEEYDKLEEELETLRSELEPEAEEPETAEERKLRKIREEKARLAAEKELREARQAEKDRLLTQEKESQTIKQAEKNRLLAEGLSEEEAEARAQSFAAGKTTAFGSKLRARVAEYVSEGPKAEKLSAEDALKAKIAAKEAKAAETKAREAAIADDGKISETKAAEHSSFNEGTLSAFGGAAPESTDDDADDDTDEETNKGASAFAEDKWDKSDEDKAKEWNPNEEGPEWDASVGRTFEETLEMQQAHKDAQQKIIDDAAEARAPHLVAQEVAAFDDEVAEAVAAAAEREPEVEGGASAFSDEVAEAVAAAAEREPEVEGGASAFSDEVAEAVAAAAEREPEVEGGASAFSDEVAEAVAAAAEREPEVEGGASAFSDEVAEAVAAAAEREPDVEGGASAFSSDEED